MRTKKNIFAVLFPAPHGPITNNELTALIAQDSMSMVTMALHNPPIPVSPVEVRTFFVYTMRRVTIKRVRRASSESEIERYGIADHMLPVTSVFWWMSTMPIATFITLAHGIAADL